MIEVFKITHNIYDAQLYTSCSAVDGLTTATQLLRCIDDIDCWMSSNRLKLNADKTQLIRLGPALQLDKVGNVRLHVCGVDISPLDHVRGLGVMLDSLLTMKQHADTVTRSCFSQMRQLRSVRRSLAFNVLHTLVHALINSKVDYCNAVLYGAPAYAVRRLQTVLYAAACLTTDTRLNEQITPVFHDTLHWLPITQCIDYKIALMTYSCVHGTSPAYCHGICRPVASVEGHAMLRSANYGELVEPVQEESAMVRRASVLLHHLSGTMYRGKCYFPSVWTEIKS